MIDFNRNLLGEEALVLSRYIWLKERIEQIEAALPHIEAEAAKGYRPWKTNYARHERKLRDALEAFRIDLEATKAVLDEYDAPADVPARASSVPPEGSSEDLYVGAAIRSMGEFLDAHFANRPDDSSRVIIPTWVGWQSAKAEVAVAAGVMDAAVVDARTAMRATQSGTLEEDRARSRYDAELDRVIGNNDLESAVKRVHSAFFTNDPLA